MGNIIQNNAHIFRWLVVFISYVIFVNPVYSQPTLTLQPVITQNLTSPMQVLHAGDGSKRIFVVERAGTIKVFGGASYNLLGTFLDLHTKVGTLSEGGLLSVAFHPDYGKAGDPNAGVLFVYYTNLATPFGNLVLEKYTVANPSGNVATVSGTQVILTIPHSSQGNHNGGEMHFGNDGLLYLSVGDGGGAGDPNRNAQKTGPATTGDLTYLLGKMLRLDVNNPSSGRNYSIPAQNPFANEIFDYGLRNPFRWSFDKQTGDMWIGDVGQNNWEEIDFRAASASGGVNYGWNCFEGPATYSGNAGCGTVTNYSPAYYYDGQSVIGGVVYRGSRYIDMMGYYVGADFYTGNMHLIKRNNTNTEWITTVQSGTLPGSVANISDIGENEDGELYAVSLTANSVYHIQSSGPLPVKLVSFDGIKTTEGTKLFWETSSEENFREFEVEYSTTMNNFISAGIVPAHNFTNGSKYQFTHTGSFLDNVYYRLKMTDADGSFDYSRIIVVNNEEAVSGIFVKPSLVNSGSINLIIEGNYQSLEVIGTNGILLSKQDISGKSGSLNIPVNAAPSGYLSCQADQQ
ncbi:sorbosone dehydrogenase family protein [Dyadobacter sp. NIV53]|uniref:PQQ-dependent sugar dehydrogenase n=1 Tax=Dyadobacter sp. NIV53 TaxID=2861765 RepID=UPI001C8891C5|nr:PQQ-dependent sugar dehydrogenase [Dyadobacter sp. NIV53]